MQVLKISEGQKKINNNGTILKTTTKSTIFNQQEISVSIKGIIISADLKYNLITGELTIGAAYSYGTLYGQRSSVTLDKNWNVISQTTQEGSEFSIGGSFKLLHIKLGAEYSIFFGDVFTESGIYTGSAENFSWGFGNYGESYDKEDFSSIDFVDIENEAVTRLNPDGTSDQQLIYDIDTFKSRNFTQETINYYNSLGWNSITDITGLNNNFQFGEQTYSYSFDNVTLPDISVNNDFKINDNFFNFPFILNNSKNYVSPLTLDLDGDGIESNHIQSQNVFFDIDNDGFAEKVGWISPDDGQLAYDVNKNGYIDNITELFGDDKQPAFQKLATFDTNKNKKIDQSDLNYNQLLVWRDLNQNGKTDSGELKTLYQTGVKEISLNEIPEKTYQNENYISGRSTYTKFDGTIRDIADVHFLNDNINTWFLGSQSQVYGGTGLKVSPDTLIMPLSRGYGGLASWHIAMSDNIKLKSIMKEIMGLGAGQFDKVFEKVEAFLFEWAGVSGNNPDARASGQGSVIDSRKVDFIEKFTDTDWRQKGTAYFIGEDASVGLKRTYGEILNVLTSRLLVQSVLSDIFPNALYDFKTDSVKLGGTITTIINNAKTYSIGMNSTVKRQFWLIMNHILIEHKQELGKSFSDITQIIDNAYGSKLYLSEIQLTPYDHLLYVNNISGNQSIQNFSYKGTAIDEFIMGSGTNDYMFSNAGNDTVYGLQGDDFLYAGDGNDTVYSGDDSDMVYGENGDDVLKGGNNGDVLRGGNGNDKLYGEDGTDLLEGGSGSDFIDGGAKEDTIILLNSNEAVYVNLATNQNYGGHANGDLYYNIENIGGSIFNDTLIGDTSDNFINGEQGNDVIYGGDGSDNLFGGEGNDKLYGDNGDDFIQGFYGTEYIDGGDGNDTLSYSHPYNYDGVYVDLLQGIGKKAIAEGDILKNIENVKTTVSNDTVIGNDENNKIYLGTGDDVASGNGGDDTLYGEIGNDTLEGGSGNDVINGGYGDDILNSGSDDDIIIDTNYDKDIIDGGSERDTLSFQGNSAIIINIANGTTNHGDSFKNIELFITSEYGDIANGSDNNDTIFLKSGNDQSFARKGNDIVYGGLGDDKIFGEDGNDIIYGEDGSDIIDGGLGNDILYGEIGNDTLEGGSGNDVIDGGLGVDYINANVGNDIIYDNDKEDDNIDGGDGYDIISFENHIGRLDIKIDSLGQGLVKTFATPIIENHFYNIESVIGTKESDQIITDKLNDIIDGGTGFDVINTDLGDDFIYDGDKENDNIDGGIGSDTISFEKRNGNIDVKINAWGQGEVKAFGVSVVESNFRNIENIIGTNGSDVITTNHVANVIDGGTGFDVINTDLGDDFIYDSDKENDNIDGGIGSDTISFEKRNGNIDVKINAWGQGEVKAFGASVVESNFRNIENIIGTNGSDVITTNHVANVVDGGTGIDHINSGAGDDLIYDRYDEVDFINGNEGTDTVSFEKNRGIIVNLSNGSTSHGDYIQNIENVMGTSYNDIIIGNHVNNFINGISGSDKLYGGLGNDTIIISTDILSATGGEYSINTGDKESDIFKLLSLSTQSSVRDYIISDFEVGIDVLDLSQLNLTKNDIVINSVNNISKITIKGNTSFGIKTTGYLFTDDNILFTPNGTVNQNPIGNGTPSDNNIPSNIFYASENKEYFSGSNTVTDIISYYNSNQGININLQNNINVGGYAEADSFYSIEGIKGSSQYNDIIYGDNNNNIIEGWGGDDIIYGADGKDHLHGGSGNDLIGDLLGYNDISGGIGSDKIEFSGSSHRIYGGNYGSTGDKISDEFILSSWHENVDLNNPNQKGDVIADFEVGVDVLNLAQLGIQYSQVSIGTYENGYMVNINTDTQSLSIGIRTGTLHLTTDDIIFKV